LFGVWIQVLVKEKSFCLPFLFWHGGRLLHKSYLLLCNGGTGKIRKSIFSFYVQVLNGETYLNEK
jgi:hypothetical protein